LNNNCKMAFMNPLSRTLDYYTLNCVLQGLSAEKNHALRFVQIGGNDGKIADPLFPFHSQFPWSGTIVEPVPFYFNRLVERNSSNPLLRLINKAISSEDGTLEIYYVSPDCEHIYKDWHRGLASTDPAHIIKHGVDKEHLASVLVDSFTPARLMESSQVEGLDLLVIDTEGHELPIIKSWPYLRFPPRLTIFEAWHMSEQSRLDLKNWALELALDICFTTEDGYIFRRTDYLLGSLLENMQSFSKHVNTHFSHCQPSD